jgi:hypothetical protein
VRGNPQALFGKRPTEKDPAKGTSPAVDFTLRRRWAQQCARRYPTERAAPVSIGAYAWQAGKFAGRRKPVVSPPFHAGAPSDSGFVKSTQSITLPIQHT